MNRRAIMREVRPEGPIYKIEGVAGQGQFATVYRAIREDSQGHSQLKVALKILKSRNAVPWLRREFETLAKVDSPYCVRVLAWENLPEGCALVLEWVDGVTLFELGKFIALCDDTIAEIIAQVQEGLRVLHSSGLHHGDLSPRNILIDRNGQVKIVDFANVTDRIDGSDGFNGTPAYIAPEIWAGGSKGLQGDLFALGLIERDLHFQFSDLPKSVDDCRRRVTELSQTKQSLLSVNPEDRKMMPLTSLMWRRKRLAACVSAIRCGQTSVLTTHPSEAFTRATYPRLAPQSAVSALLVIIVGALPVRAQAPSVNEKRTFGSLVVRSQKWMSLELNGVQIGFAPFDGAQMSAGFHHLKWRTRTGHGEVRLFIGSGQHVRVTEKDLSEPHLWGKR